MSSDDGSPAADRPETDIPGPVHRPALDEIGVTVPVGLTLGSSGAAAVALINTVVYEKGFELWVRIAVRPDHADGWRPSFTPNRNAVGPERLRLGVRFSDGRTATNTGSWLGAERDEDASAVLMRQGNGGGVSTPGKGSSFTFRHWISPLPSPGRLWIVCEWPHFEIPLTYREVDADSILAASTRAVRFWGPHPSPR